jgi:hypothetical protein
MLIRIIAIVTLFLSAISCSDDSISSSGNDIEVIHGFVSTLTNGEPHSMYGDTALNKFEVNHSFGAVVHPNPVYGGGLTLLSYNIYEKSASLSEAETLFKKVVKSFKFN